MERNLLPFLPARKCNLIRAIIIVLRIFIRLLFLSFSLSQRSLDDRKSRRVREKKGERVRRERRELSFDEFVRRIRTIEKKKERKKERNNYSVGSQVASRNQRAEAG